MDAQSALLLLVFLVFITIGLVTAALTGRGRVLDVYVKKNQIRASVLFGLTTMALMICLGSIAAYGSDEYTHVFLTFLSIGLSFGIAAGVATYIRLRTATRVLGSMRSAKHRVPDEVLGDRKIMGVNIKDVMKSDGSDHKD